MRVRILTYLIAISFGLALAGSFVGPWLVGTPLEEFAPPKDVTNYKPPVTPTGTGIIGDFLFAFSKFVEWLGKIPDLTAALLSTFGVPEPYSDLISLVAGISVTLAILYIISGRDVKI